MKSQKPTNYNRDKAKSKFIDRHIIDTIIFNEWLHGRTLKQTITVLRSYGFSEITIFDVKRRFHLFDINKRN